MREFAEPMGDRASWYALIVAEMRVGVTGAAVLGGKKVLAGGPAVG